MTTGQSTRLTCGPSTFDGEQRQADEEASRATQRGRSPAAPTRVAVHTWRRDAGGIVGEPRITPRTARLCALAAQLALLDGSASIGPLHLAAALLEEPGAVAWAGLRAAAITPDVALGGILRRRSGWRMATPAAASEA